MNISIKKDSELFASIEREINNSQQEYINFLEKIVDIDTNTGNLEGSKKIAQILKQELESIGAQIELKESDYGVHLIARLYGNGNKKVLIYDHTDTVLPNQKDFHFSYNKESQIAYGPGTSDSKGSVAFLIQNLKNMHKLGFTPYKELILYLDAEEETASAMSDMLVEQLSKEVDYAFVADAGRPNLGIVTKRKTVGRYEILIEGSSGHAGNGVQSSINAMVEAGYLIVELDKLQSPLPGNPADFTQKALEAKNIVDWGQYVPANTINIGVLEQLDGGKPNIIPGKVKLILDVRCFEQSEHKRIEKAIFNIAEKKHSPFVKITVTGSQSYQPVESKGVQKQFADLYVQIGKDLLGREITQWQAGGVTPGNVIAQYVPIIDSVGMDADPALEHSIYEELYVDAYIPRSILMMVFLDTVDKIDIKRV